MLNEQTRLIVYFADPPDLVSGFSDLIRNESDVLRLHCQFTGTPLPSVIWYRNVSSVNRNVRNVRDKISITDQKSNENRQTDSYLEVVNLIKGDEGTYSCLGTNGIMNLIDAEDTSKAFITIHG